MTPGGRRRPFIRQVQSPNRQGLAEEAGDVVPGPQHGADSVGTVLPGTLTPLPPSFAARGLSWLLHPRPVLRLAPPPTQGIATGKYHAAVLTNSAEWEAACVKAGRRCGDLVHPPGLLPRAALQRVHLGRGRHEELRGGRCAGRLRDPRRGSCGAPDPHAAGKHPERGRGSLWSPPQWVYCVGHWGSPLQAVLLRDSSITPG